jgi:hypothetical protein
MGDAPNALRENGFEAGIARFVPILKEGLISLYLIDLAWNYFKSVTPRGVRHPGGLHTKTHICSLCMQIF